MSADFYSGSVQEQQRCLHELALVALAHWPIQCTELNLIKQRENAVYEVVTDSGTRYALRVHRAGYHSDAALRSEFQWMAALQKTGLQLPQVVPCTSGDNFSIVEHASVPEPRQVDLLAWIEGDQLGSVEDGLGDNLEDIARIYSTIGQAAAQVHTASGDWELPKGFTRHAWDCDGLVGENPFWGRFWELEALSDAQRELVNRARETVRQKLSDLEKTPANYGMLHADLVPENILVDAGQVRLIDFDDAGFGWHMFELATALYFIQDDPNYAVARDALISAYVSERGVSEQALSTLPLFMLARSFTYLGWVHTRPDTGTAREVTPLLVDMCCALAEEYLKAA